MRADGEGNRKGTLILTMSTKPSLSFLLLITLNIFFTLASYTTKKDARKNARLTQPNGTRPARSLSRLQYR